MEAAASTTTAWAVLLPVIIGGVIGLLSGAVVPVISHYLTEKKERQAKRTARFEEMMDVVYQHDHWLSRNRAVETFGKEAEIGPSPLPKAVTIASLYFPEMLGPLSEVKDASTAYELWMVTSGLKRLRNDINTLSEGFESAYRPYREATDKFLVLAIEYTKKRNGDV